MNRTPATSTAARAEPWCVVVIGQERTVFAHGRHTRTLSYVSPGIMSDPGWMLDRAAEQFDAAGEGTLITRYVPLSEWGGDPRSPLVQLAEFMGKARAAGWQCSDAAIRHGSGWVTFTRDGCATVHMGVLDAMPPDTVRLFGLDDEPDVIAESLAAYRDAVGVPYRATPGVAGLAMLRHWYSARPLPRGVTFRDEPRWQWHELGERMPPTPGDLIWNRAPSSAEKRMPYVWAFDVNAQYLAAASVAELGWMAPTRTGAIPFDPTRPGLWRIVARAAAQWGKGLPPFLNPAKIESDRTAWVTTPVLSFLHERAVVPEVLDSYTCEPVRRVRILRPWAERLRDARAFHGRPAGHPDECGCPPCRLAATVKQTYTHAIGLMATQSARVVRPDWSATVRDLARVNLLRKLISAVDDHGLVPLRVHRDCVWYASDEPVGVLAEQLAVSSAGQIGKFKIEHSKCTTMAAHLDEHTATARGRSRRA